MLWYLTTGPSSFRCSTSCVVARQHRLGRRYCAGSMRSPGALPSADFGTCGPLFRLICRYTKGTMGLPVLERHIVPFLSWWVARTAPRFRITAGLFCGSRFFAISRFACPGHGGINFSLVTASLLSPAPSPRCHSSYLLPVFATAARPQSSNARPAGSLTSVSKPMPAGCPKRSWMRSSTRCNVPPFHCCRRLPKTCRSSTSLTVNGSHSCRSI